MSKNRGIGLILAIVLVTAVVYGGIKITEPSYSLTMDVNPSIEIVSNRLDRVVEVNPLNDDAREMLKDFEVKDRDLTATIEDLADLMVLTGYISGGEDNLVMITVSDGSTSQEDLNKLNRAIAAYLENKQIEATIVNQAIPENDQSNQTGREVVAKKIDDLDDELDYETLADMSLRELIAYAESKNINPETLFTNLVRTKSGDSVNMVESPRTQEKEKSNTEFKTLIGDERAKEIALEKTQGGKIVEFEFDWDDGIPEYKFEIERDGYEYEVEIHGYTGHILDFEKDD